MDEIQEVIARRTKLQQELAELQAGASSYSMKIVEILTTLNSDLLLIAKHLHAHGFRGSL